MSAYSILMMAHSGWRYIVLIALIVAVVWYFIAWLRKSPAGGFSATMNRWLPIIIDIQWLLGLVIWIWQTWWNNGDVLRAWEHPVMMTLAVVAAHLTSSRVRKADTDEGKNRTAAIGYLITLLIIALAVWRIVGSLFGSAV